MDKVIDPEAAPLFDEVREVFGLSEREIADLFRVQRLTAWRSAGIPKPTGDAERLQGLARAFNRELIRSRIPALVRTPDAWLGDRPILAVLIAEGPDAVYGYLSRVFAYADGA